MRDIIQNVTFRKPTIEGVDAAKVSDLLEKAYLAQRREDKYTQKTSFSPSSIGYGKATCPRYWYIMFSGVMGIDQTDALGIANMSYGSDAHDRIQKLFKDSGVLVEAEREIKTINPPVRGFIDLVVNIDGKDVIGEIKTTRQEMFVHRQASMKPVAYHNYQVLLYMWATGLKTGFLLYENKNTQEFLVIPVEMNEKNKQILEKALQWMREVDQTYKDKKLPTRPFTRKSVVCKDCPLANTCWDVLPEGDVKLLPMEVIKP